MIPTDLARVVAATGAAVHGAVTREATVTGVTIDSRQVAAGDLFVAIRGERHDGHDHAGEALAAGAVAVLGERALDVPCLVVDDAVAGLGRLAADVLARLRAQGAPDVVGITGSVGKTSTKDLMGQLLARLGPTVVPVGSYNNEVGLPTTVLRCDERTRFLVLEMGSRGVGHIRALTRVAPPRVGVVLGVGSAHVGEFGSLEVTARAKGELVEALPPASAGGLAVLNQDDPRVAAMTTRTSARVLTFGTGPGAEVRAEDVRLDDEARASFRLHLGGEVVPVSLGLYGLPAVQHALAAAAVAHSLGMSPVEVAAALGAATPQSPGRMQVARTPGGVTIVNDAYNASPESVAAALRALVAMAAPHAGGEPGRSWAVLGEMRELGAASDAEHAAVGRLAARLGVSRLVAVGAPALLVGGREDTTGGAAVAVPDPDAALVLLRAQLRPGDVVLVKASRAVGLDRVADALLATPAEAAP